MLLRRNTIVNVPTDEQWRCSLCGTATLTEEVYCRNCGKRRWQGLNIDTYDLARRIDEYVAPQLGPSIPTEIDSEQK